ncbi:DUF4334 domain-containing protein [uncultured Streptomyces sp.]|uniref:DUF4334 domain-containing protein n=1 Tax=uncultured Streptomyces sp. TaxID=174707 RepID=UPI00262A3E37|nr:DUF4334 domain-containing protein [uncultured Streptomyces sp.]
MTNAAEARDRIAEIRRDGGRTTLDELDALWAALRTVRPQEILGPWRGSEFVSGHRFEGELRKARWYGKTFHSVTDAKPLICRGDDGELYSNVAMGKGEASLWTVEFRGEPTATMVYDGRPVLDHFKRIDDSTLLGVMNGKGVLDEGRHYYFLLDRD